MKANQRLTENKRLSDLVASHPDLVLARPEIAAAVFPDPEGPSPDLVWRTDFYDFAEAVVAGQTCRCPRCKGHRVVRCRGSLPSGNCKIVCWSCPACGKETVEHADFPNNHPAWRYPVRSFQREIVRTPRICGSTPSAVAALFGGRLMDAWARLAGDALDAAAHGRTLPPADSRNGPSAKNARLLRRAAPFVFARPDIAAAPLPGRRMAEPDAPTFTDWIRSECGLPDVSPPSLDRPPVLARGPSSLRGLFDGRLVAAYSDCALEELADLDRTAAAAIRDGRSFHATFRLRAPGGTEFEVAFGAVGGWAMLFDAAGHPTGRGVRAAYDPATGLADTLRDAILAVGAGGAAKPLETVR